MNMRLQTWVAAWLIAASPAISVAANDEAPLIAAAKRGERDVVRSLVSRRADVNVREADGTTALHWAVRADDRETVALLIRAGADVRAANQYGITPLWQAAVNGNAAVIEALLAAGADPNAALPSGETPLLVAAHTGKVDAVKALVARGADIHAKENLFGQTALMLAAAENHADVARLLIEVGADVKARSTENKSKPFALSNPFRGGFTPLHFAARHGSIDAARVLLAQGAELNAREPEGISPLLLAIFNGHYDFAAILIERGADVNLADESGRTPLYQAIDMRRLEFIAGRPAPEWTDKLDTLDMVKLLLARGADPNAKLTKRQPARKAASPTDAWLIEGTTPFLKAAKNADVPVLRVLLEHGADPYAEAPRLRASALMFAAGVGWRELSSIAPEKEALEAVRLLWELGGYKIDAVTSNTGQTALHGAASRGAVSIIEYLAAQGADLYVKDKREMTALDEAGPVAEGGSGGSGGVKHPARPEAQALLQRLMTASPPTSTSTRP
jgi:ankyrin repeat protein